MSDEAVAPATPPDRATDGGAAPAEADAPMVTGTPEDSASGEAAASAIDSAMASGTPDDLATAPAGALTQALELLQAGGPVVGILVAMSVLATAVVLLKLWQFHQLKIGERRLGRRALQLYSDGHPKEALFLARSAPSPVAQALARAIRGVKRGLPEVTVREEVLRYGGDVLENLRGGFRILEVIASLAPLLGLFGTVLGMIEAFRQLEAAGNQVNPAILSGGIWQALLTTAVGLAVAMPVVAVLNWLERRVDALAHEMDSVVTRVFTEDLSTDLLEGNQDAGKVKDSERDANEETGEPYRRRTAAAE